MDSISRDHIIAFDRKEFELRFHPERPKEHQGLLPLNFPEFILGLPKKNTIELSLDEFRQTPNLMSLRFGLLITNKSHKGLWLIRRRHYKAIIPGEELIGEIFNSETIQGFDFNRLYMKSLVTFFRDEWNNYHEEHIMTDPFTLLFGDVSYRELRDTLMLHIMKNFGFHNMTWENKWYYQYYLDLPLVYRDHIYQTLDNIYVFQLIEVNEPEDPEIKECRKNQFIWLPSNSLQFLEPIKQQIMSNLNLQYKVTGVQVNIPEYDIHFNMIESGILENIFDTQSIFGKLDIY